MSKSIVTKLMLFVFTILLISSCGPADEASDEDCQTACEKHIDLCGATATYGVDDCSASCKDLEGGDSKTSCVNDAKTKTCEEVLECWNAWVS